MKSELAGGFLVLLATGACALALIGLLLRTENLVPWQLWGAIAFGVTFCATLVVSVWWYDRWRGKR